MTKKIDLMSRGTAATCLGLLSKQLDAETELTRVNLNGVTYFIAQEIKALVKARARTATKQTTLSPGNPQARKISLEGSGIKWGTPIGSKRG